MTVVETAGGYCRGKGMAGREEGVAVGPASVYEAVTRQMVEGLTEELREIKGRLNGLLFMVAGAMLIDVALRVTEIGR